MNIETGMTAVFSMSVMFWIRIKKICVTPQKAARPRIERRIIGWLQVAEKLRMGERILRLSCLSPTLMQKPAMVVTTLRPR